MARERVGILGGAFDPIHQGHLQMALSALDSCGLDRVLFVPAGDDAYKPCVVSREDRWKMTVAACSRDHRLIPSRLEIDRSGTAWSVDTLLALKKENPKAEYFFLLGSDGVMKLRGWHRLEEVIPLCSFLICPRAGVVPRSVLRDEIDWLRVLGCRISQVRMEPVSISSTEIRNRLAAGQTAPGLSAHVREYCALRGLYGLPRSLDRADEWLGRLFADLTPRRFAHSLSVAAYAVRLARIHGVDRRQAEEAGLLHDCAKCMPLKEMQRIAVEHALTDDPEILSSGALMHSLVGAWVARNAYGMADPEVLEAIAYHNTGHAGMSRLAMCICLADSIEPERGSYPLLEQIRALAGQSLERALLMSLESTADYVRRRGKYLHPRTQETIDWLKTLPEVRNARQDAGSAEGI